MGGQTVQTSATTDPLTYTEIRDFLRLDEGVDENILVTLNKMATQFVENFTGRALINRTINLFIDGIDEVDVALWEGVKVGPDISLRKRYIELPTTPVSSVSSISSFNDEDTETTFASTKYYVDTAREPARVYLRDGEAWPTGLRVANAIKIVYVAGYGANKTDIPEAIKMALLQLIAHKYEHRGDFEGNLRKPLFVEALLQPYRKLSFSNNPFGTGSGMY